MYDRLIDLFTNESLKKLNNIKILLIGVGGVGSFCLEALIRSGVQNITIIDADVYEESNLNRQLHSNINVIGKSKVEVLKDSALKINPTINIIAIKEFLTKESQLDLNSYDYIIDACDSVAAKKMLILKAYQNHIKIISALGVGKRLDPTKISITTLKKTINDPLGKKLRHELNKESLEFDVPVVSSCESPIKGTDNTIASYIGVSSYAGILLADYIIKDVLNGNK